MKAAPVGGLLYSLIHLGGFSGDIAFYRSRYGGGRVLEMGCGDGRLGVSLCFADAAPPLSVLQQLQRTKQADTLGPRQPVADKFACRAYVGVEISDELAMKARQRLADASDAQVTLRRG